MSPPVTAGDICTRAVVFADPRIMGDAARLMRTHHVGSLVVVALDDLLTVVAEQMQALAAAVGAAQRHEVPQGHASG